MRTIPPCTNYKLSEELSASFTMIVATVVELKRRRTNTHQTLECEYKATVGSSWQVCLKNCHLILNKEENEDE